MRQRWSFLVSVMALGVLFLVCFLPKALSMNLPIALPTPSANHQLFVTDMLKNTFESDLVLSDADDRDGMMGVDAIKSLNLTPNDAAPQAAVTPNIPEPSAPVQTPTQLQSQYQPPEQAQASNPDTIQPVSMVSSLPDTTPQGVPTFLILPVPRQGAGAKAFSDLPILLSTEVANQLTNKLQQSGSPIMVLNPIYAFDDLQEKSLDGLYQKIVADYTEAGRPNEADLRYLTEKLSSKNQRIQWVAFVQAEFDSSHTSKPRLYEQPFITFMDHDPREPYYYLQGNVRIYSMDAGLPIQSEQSTSTRLKFSDLNTFTKSVNNDSTNKLIFRTAAAKMAGSLIAKAPTDVPVAQSHIEGQLVTPGISSSKVTVKDQQTFQRILQY